MTISFTVTLDFSPLTTFVACDETSAELLFERQVHTTRDAALALADRRAERSQASQAAALAKVDSEILSAQNLIAAPGIDPVLRQDTADKLELLQAQRKQIVKRGRQSSGATRFLTSIDGIQADGQVEIIDAVLAGIAAHRATLSA